MFFSIVRLKNVLGTTKFGGSQKKFGRNYPRMPPPVAKGLPITYLSSTSLASCNLKSGFRRFFPQLYVTRARPQRHKKRMLTVIHFKSSRSFFHRDIFCKRQFGIVKKRALNQNKNTNIIAYRNAGNCPRS